MSVRSTMCGQQRFSNGKKKMYKIAFVTEYRNSCRACRLAKCLAEGMNPESLFFAAITFNVPRIAVVKKDQPPGGKRQKPVPPEHSEESADEKKVKQEHSGHPEEEEAASSTSATGVVVEEPEFGEVLDALLHHYRRLNVRAECLKHFIPSINRATPRPWPLALATHCPHTKHPIRALWPVTFCVLSNSAICSST